MDRHRQPGQPGPPGPPDLDPDELARKRKRQRQFIALGAVAVMLLGFVVLAGTYFVVSVPAPKDLAKLSENSSILSAGGKILAKVGTENRTYVPISKIPKYVQHAVVTAEDRTFYTNSGIDIKGILRAAWNNLTDDDVEGASTITQQYVRNALDLTREQSYTRKIKEAVMAVKLNQTKSKDEILEGYLNTIYFGRNANGIGAAAQAYFGKDVDKLTEAEGALLATVIKNPSGYDPGNKGGAERAEPRWRWVLNSMVEMNWLDPQKVAAAKFPKTKKDTGNGAQFGLTKPTGNVVKYVVQELEQAGISEQELYTGGYSVYTTISLKAQRSAERAVRTVLHGQDKKLTAALVGVEPGTGRVLAYYGSKQGVVGWDNAAARHQPGSSFKAYVLAAALENDMSIKSYWDGSSPKEFPDRVNPVRNSDNKQCPRCTMEQSTVQSLNTPYYAITSKVGKENVIALANKAGVRTMKRDVNNEVVKLDEPGAAGKFGNEVGIGQYPISVLDNASGFATFAAGGKAAKTHFVDKVMRDDEVVYETKVETQQAFSPETAADATYVLRKVVAGGQDNLADGRPSAGKTGTWQYRQTEDNAHAWMAGYTPQLAAAVWMGRSGDEGPIRTREGMKIYGSGLPAEIWKYFMNGALQGKEIEQFPEPVFGGDENAGNIESPSPSPSVSKPGNPKPGDPKPGGPGPKFPTESPSPWPTAPSPSPTESCNPLDPKCKPGG